MVVKNRQSVFVFITWLEKLPIRHGLVGYVHICNLFIKKIQFKSEITNQHLQTVSEFEFQISDSCTIFIKFLLFTKWNLLRLGSHTNGMMTKTVHKTLTFCMSPPVFFIINVETCPGF